MTPGFSDALRSRGPQMAVLILLLSLACALTAIQDFGNRALTRTSEDMVVMGYNLFRHGTLSLDQSESRSPRPTAKREPLYPLLIAAVLSLDSNSKALGYACLVGAQPACHGALYRIKLLNVALLLATAWLAAALCFHLTASVWLAGVAFMLVGFSIRLSDYAAHILPECLAALLLLCVSVLVRNLATRDRLSFYALAGLCLGALVLTKAVFLYLWVLLAAGLLLRGRRNFGGLLVFLLAYATVTGGWMVRNQAAVGEWLVSERGGRVLGIRAEYNRMTPGEYGAALLYWNPLFGRQRAPQLVASENLVRLDRRNPAGFYRRGKVERIQRIADATGLQGAALDAALREDAYRQIREHALRHLWLTPLMAYRGLFVEQGWELRPLAGISIKAQLSAFAGLILFFACFRVTWRALRRRESALLLFLLPSAYLFFLNAFATHNITRYNLPMIPVLVVCVVLVLAERRRRPEVAR
ncbi:MAG: hypothetical protein LJE84_02370 [Gammaproteobacteria bacterium]|nr:hypothetical protein [Gammaproteobacteria bacterium]